MIHIALVDDEPQSLDTIEKKFKTFIEEHYHCSDVMFLKYDSGESLLADISNHKFSLVVLDCQMPNLSGYETAVKIRAKDKKLIIVFYTNYPEYWQKGYKVQALRYILKSASDEDLIEDFKDIMLSILDVDRVISFKQSAREVLIHVEQIIWFEANKRFTDMHMVDYKDKTITVHEGINEIFERLADSGFIRTHKSCCVNVRYVNEIENQKGDLYLLLSNGERVYVARNRKKEVRRYILAFIGGNL